MQWKIENKNIGGRMLAFRWVGVLEACPFISYIIALMTQPYALYVTVDRK